MKQSVIPAKAGIQRLRGVGKTLDSGFRRNDEREAMVFDLVMHTTQGLVGET
jgi:hypothetical protein